MGKQKLKDNNNKTASNVKTTLEAVPKQGPRLTIPVLPLFFILVWLWAWLYYGCVFQVAREYSYWSADSRVLQFFLSCGNPGIRWLGRLVLQLYKYPWLGGLSVAFILTAGSWLLGYALRLPARVRFLRFLPALAYIAVVSYQGINMFFEAETGYILGVPCVILAALAVLAAAVRVFSHSAFLPRFLPPRGEGVRYSLYELAFCLALMGGVLSFNESQRPYSRTITQLMYLSETQQWRKMQEVARDNAVQSNRPMACFYAMSLVHTGEIAQRMYDIRLDYDSLYLFGMDGYHNNASAMYVPEGSLHAGFVQTCMHNCMENMVMTGPTVRLLKLLVKCSLLRGEWLLAEKYLRLLSDVPFEGDFISKYGAMVRQPALVEADPEFARIRLTEPIHDSFENMYQQPVFMGYNLALTEGRSMEALTNSLCVCLYTKLMPMFIERLAPIVGTTPSDIIADGVLLSSTKQPGIEGKFVGLQYRTSKIQAFMQAVQPYMSDRAGHAYELFDKYKGYYPYYYFFGNLKATKKGLTGPATSNSGVN